MSFEGHIQNGVVVFDEPVTVAEGTAVRVEVIAPRQDDEDLAAMMLKYAGKAVGLPADAARNYDHYLYGTPKK